MFTKKKKKAARRIKTHASVWKHFIAIFPRTRDRPSRLEANEHDGENGNRYSASPTFASADIDPSSTRSSIEGRHSSAFPQNSTGLECRRRAVEHNRSWLIFARTRIDEFQTSVVASYTSRLPRRWQSVFLSTRFLENRSKRRDNIHTGGSSGPRAPCHRRRRRLLTASSVLARFDVVWNNSWPGDFSILASDETRSRRSFAWPSQQVATDPWRYHRTTRFYRGEHFDRDFPTWRGVVDRQ